MNAASRQPTRAPTLALVMLGALAVLLVLGLAAGSRGLEWPSGDEWPWVWDIRAPRTIGAALVGALLGLAGALAQGLFRNPLADPYLLGSAAGAELGVVLVLAAGGLVGVSLAPALALPLQRVGLVGAAFAGAWIGMALTVSLARGAARPMLLLLAGVAVGVLLTAAANLVLLFSPEALRGKQVFLLGSTSYLDATNAVLLAMALAIALPLSMRLARVLDALVLGEESATSLGLPLPRLRAALIALLAVATGTAVAQAGLVAFVGLVAPHIVRRLVIVRHAGLLALSALTGALLLLAADLLARTVVAPQELPVGLVTALTGGLYLLVLLHRRAGGLS
jgi:iron complex transport system permease protein